MSKCKSWVLQSEYNRWIYIDDDVGIKDRNIVAAYFLHFKECDKNKGGGKSVWKKNNNDDKQWALYFLVLSREYFIVPAFSATSLHPLFISSSLSDSLTHSPRRVTNKDAHFQSFSLLPSFFSTIQNVDNETLARLKYADLTTIVLLSNRKIWCDQQQRTCTVHCVCSVNWLFAWNARLKMRKDFSHYDFMLIIFPAQMMIKYCEACVCAIASAYLIPAMHEQNIIRNHSLMVVKLVLPHQLGDTFADCVRNFVCRVSSSVFEINMKWRQFFVRQGTHSGVGEIIIEARSE